MTLILSVGAHKNHVNEWDSVEETNTNSIKEWICQSSWAPYVFICKSDTTSTTTTESTTDTTTEDTSTSSSTDSTFELETTTPGTTDSTDSSSSPSSLERAYWCHLANGTYLSLGYSFMHTPCALCQCTQLRSVICTTLRCMDTYCIDDSTPISRQDQCCAQCAYEATSTSCAYNGITFPHGTIIRNIGNNLKCWCQLGTVECRRSTASIFAGLDVWGTGTAVYIIIIIVLGMLLLGTLLCCSCTALYYYYYHRNRHVVQQVYDQYWNNAGWQPMSEEGHVVDGNAGEKQVQAEQNQQEFEHPTGNSEAYIPPPYALYNGANAADEKAKDQKFM
ncbi:unnamed protein product [Rotaria sordida]|uniref:VWFC domain-containing protein n=1 Tax=Rotaria sordida TaxID=392033 RepID=A0A814SHC1_9BILA|nr:unnamed protein product [Rotaria sordida]CAF1284236.1 unnamed protein product [Rotaria sordida]CAF3923994.1 unnamed protein product [Rotaria sordida]CAF3959529.1 unnamed protein product [Rotaria sordida]